VTLCIGQQYQSLWKQHCARNWESYARRHGYALVVLDRPLDPAPAAARRSPAWQKCLVLEQPELAGCDRVVWIDSDILINRAAPPVGYDVPTGKIGAVVSGDYLAPAMKPIFLARARGKLREEVEGAAAWEADQRVFYAEAGLDPPAADIVQTGVLVLEP